MPQVSPPTAPENEDDLFEGAPAAPRQIPGSGTPIVSPKGDVRTGEPVKDWGDPGQMAGSAPNLVRAWARWRERQTPTVESVSASGGPISAGRMPTLAGMVTNPGHWLARLMGKVDPEGYTALEKAPGRATFVDTPQEGYNRINALGVTTPVRNFRDYKDVILGVSPETRAKDYAEVVGSHEMSGHAVPMTTTGSPFPYTRQQGIDRLVQEAQSPVIAQHTPSYLGRLMGLMQGTGGPAHAAVEVDANRIAAPQGYRPLVRSLREVDPDIGRENASLLQQLMRR